MKNKITIRYSVKNKIWYLLGLVLTGVALQTSANKTQLLKGSGQLTYYPFNTLYKNKNLVYSHIYIFLNHIVSES